MTEAISALSADLETAFAAEKGRFSLRSQRGRCRRQLRAAGTAAPLREVAAGSALSADLGEAFATDEHR